MISKTMRQQGPQLRTAVPHRWTQHTNRTPSASAPASSAEQDLPPQSATCRRAPLVPQQSACTRHMRNKALQRVYYSTICCSG